MTVPLRLEPEVLRCAAFHRGTGASPGGSAGSYDAFLCVEVPLPWGRDISEHQPFAALGSGPALIGADGRRWRPQGLVPSVAGSQRVTVLAAEAGTGASPYERREWSVPPAEVAGVCRALLGADDAAIAAFDRWRLEVDPERLDVLVCAHGRRDTCCGSSGPVLVEQSRVALADRVAAGRLRLWRTSHTGGHRFAPTALTLPDGAMWAHLDVVSLAAVVDRSAPPAGVLEHCRGVCSAGGPPEQMADLVALSEVGWSWLERDRSVEVVHQDRRSLDTTLRVRGGGLDVEVLVQLERQVPTPSCGRVQEPEFAVAPVWSARLLDARDQRTAQ